MPTRRRRMFLKRKKKRSKEVPSTDAAEIRERAAGRAAEPEARAAFVRTVQSYTNAGYHGSPRVLREWIKIPPEERNALWGKISNLRQGEQQFNHAVLALAERLGTDARTIVKLIRIG